MFCPSSSDEVVFRAELEPQSCFQEYLRYYEYWAIESMYPILQLEADGGSQVLLVDKLCPIYTSSLDSSECLSSVASDTCTSSCISASDVGGIAVGMLLLGILLPVTATLFCVLVRYYKIKRSKRCKDGEEEKYEDVRWKKSSTTPDKDPQYMTIGDMPQKKESVVEESVVNIGGAEYVNPNVIMDRENLTDSSHRTAAHCRYTETKPAHQQRTKQPKRRSNTNQALSTMKQPAMTQPVVKQLAVKEQTQATNMRGSGQKQSAGGGSGKALEGTAKAGTSAGFYPTTSSPSCLTVGSEMSVRDRVTQLNQTDRFPPTATAAKTVKPVESSERESAREDISFLLKDTTRQGDAIPRKK